MGSAVAQREDEAPTTSVPGHPLLMSPDGPSPLGHAGRPLFLIDAPRSSVPIAGSSIGQFQITSPARVLLRELRERGYTGGYTLLTDWLRPQRE